MSEPDTSAEVEWPREIWAAERGEFEPNGWHVFSEFATIARFEGDTADCEFHWYIDGDIHESQQKYYDEMLTQVRAENAALQARVDELEGAMKDADNCVTFEINPSNYGHDEVCLLNDQVTEAILCLRAALKGDAQAEGEKKQDAFFANLIAEAQHD